MWYIRIGTARLCGRTSRGFAGACRRGAGFVACAVVGAALFCLAELHPVTATTAASRTANFATGGILSVMELRYLPAGSSLAAPGPHRSVAGGRLRPAGGPALPDPDPGPPPLPPALFHPPPARPRPPAGGAPAGRV